MGFKQGYLEIRIQVKVIIVALLIFLAWAAFDHGVFADGPAPATGSYTCESTFWSHWCPAYDPDTAERDGVAWQDTRVEMFEFKDITVTSWCGKTRTITLGHARFGGFEGRWYDISYWEAQ